MSAVLDRVVVIAAKQSGIPSKRLSAVSAVDQDMRISGDDVTEFAEALAQEFGDQVWQWPWQRFANLSEGLPLTFPIILIWQLITWPFRGAFEYPSPYERLELGHIAAVIERGHWVEP